MKQRWLFTIGLIGGLIIGGFGGFVAGVASIKAARSFFIDLFTNESPANIKSPMTHDSTNFVVQYPGNWKIDTEDEDYDPDHYLSIDSPGDSFALLTIVDGEHDTKEGVEKAIAFYEGSFMKTKSREPFQAWGNYEGEGVALRGKVLSIFAGEIRIFSHTSQEKTFTVIEFTYDEDQKKVDPGFKLIQETFQLITSGDIPQASKND
jgi:hypothetical protein